MAANDQTPGLFRPVVNPRRPNRQIMRIQLTLIDYPDIYKWLKAQSEEFGISMPEVARQAIQFAMKAE